MWKYSLILSYLGTDFCGWQKQKTIQGEDSQSSQKTSIQETLEKVILRMTKETVSIVGSGRTDSGVHAIGQVAHFVLKEKNWDIQILHRGLNSLLPISVQVLKVQQVPLSFHAQRNAVKKQYSYYFQQGPCAIPHLTPLSWWIKKPLDVDAMSKALHALVGEHDFKPFQGAGSKPGSTVRTILEADVTRIPVPFPLGVPGLAKALNEEMSMVRVRVLGTGFLKQMVRGIAGTLLQVGESRREVACMHEILEKCDRSLVGPTAPARALWLEQVWYPDLVE